MNRRKRVFRRNTKIKPPSRTEVTKAVDDYLKHGGRITQLYIDPDDYNDYVNRTGRLFNDTADSFLIMV